jgi:hypothetical protein
MSGKNAISTGESAMIEGFLENTTPILAQQVLRNLDCGHWTHTEARVLLICGICPVHLQVQHRTYLITHLHPTGWGHKGIPTRGDLLLLLILSLLRILAGSQVKTRLF